MPMRSPFQVNNKPEKPGLEQTLLLYHMIEKSKIMTPIEGGWAVAQWLWRQRATSLATRERAFAPACCGAQRCRGSRLCTSGGRHNPDALP